jgi:hypothetical protein
MTGSGLEGNDYSPSAWVFKTWIGLVWVCVCETVCLVCIFLLFLFVVVYVYACVRVCTVYKCMYTVCTSMNMSLFI